MPETTYHQTTSPWVGLADFLGRLIDPALLALIHDDSGRAWPCGSGSDVPIDFVDTGG